MNTQSFPLPHWFGNVFSDFLRSRRERLFTQKTAASMLRLHRHFELTDPLMARYEIYAQVVMAHLRCNRGEALELLERAETSYANWPSPRELTFCDVVHCVSFCEFTKNFDAQYGTQTDLTSLVASNLPKGFCTHSPVQ
jgi:hypothetical protein